MRQRYVQFHGVSAHSETDKSVLCEFANGIEDWIPFSQLGPRSEVRRAGDEGMLECTQWIAEVKGLDPERMSAKPPEPVKELRRAKSVYRRLVNKYHPDRSPGTHETMRDINELWQAVLTDLKDD